MASGGTREGAGRKPKKDKYVTALTKIDRFVAEHMDELLEAQLELARGLLVQDLTQQDTEGNPRVYRTIPDAKAGQYLIDRLAGKPTQKQEIAGKDGKDLEIRVTYANRRIDPSDIIQ